MSSERMQDKAKVAKGEVKEGLGNLVGDDTLAEEGQREQTSGRLEEAAHSAKDALRKVKDSVTK